MIQDICVSNKTQRGKPNNNNKKQIEKMWSNCGNLSGSETLY